MTRFAEQRTIHGGRTPRPRGAIALQSVILAGSLLCQRRRTCAGGLALVGVRNWLITPLMSPPCSFRACATPRTQLRSVITSMLFATQSVLAAGLGVASFAATELRPGDKPMVLERDFSRAQVSQIISSVTFAALPSSVGATAYTATRI